MNRNHPVSVHSSLTIHSLASGSSANALLLRHNGVSLLIDCGLPIRRFQSSLHALGLTVRDIDYVFVTHEHSDHIRALPQLRRAGSTVMTSRGTAGSLKLGPTEYSAVAAGLTYDIAGFVLRPCAASHDSAEPLSLSIEVDGMVISVMTDMGQVSEAQIDALAASSLIVLEANHDVDMLRTGPYPPHLKRRVLSQDGHLSNVDAGKALRSAMARSSLDPLIWLAHLSETNNRPATASTTVRQHIPGANVRVLPRHDTVDLQAPTNPENGCESHRQIPLFLKG